MMAKLHYVLTVVPCSTKRLLQASTNFCLIVKAETIGQIKKPTYSNVLNSQQAPVHQRLGPQKSFVPSSRTPVNQWVHGRNMGFGQRNVEKGNSSNFNPKKDPESRKYDYRNNYKGKNPMTRSQWRRYQRQKKVAAQKSQITVDSKGERPMELAKRPMRERLGEPKS
ncbi:hypothetical protein P8452_02671 [Trifolium repens]|nr:hypothetical protein P8452_02671 [Trifolium repens]